MDITTLRALALDCNFGALGVDVTVTRPFPNEAPIEARGIWVTPLTQDAGGVEFTRKEQRRVIALLVAEVGTVPRGTVIVAPENGTTYGWRVDGIEKVEAEHVRATVVRDPDYHAVLDV
jgi:hypothetical protein